VENRSGSRRKKSLRFFSEIRRRIINYSVLRSDVYSVFLQLTAMWYVCLQCPKGSRLSGESCLSYYSFNSLSFIISSEKSVMINLGEV